MNEPQSSVPASLPNTPAPLRANAAQFVPLAIAWAAVLAVAGGFLAGMLIFKFRMIGALSLWGIGALGGFVSR